jgi:RNA polymerase sigma-70 factor (ECF subfamily)
MVAGERALEPRQQQELDVGRSRPELPSAHELSLREIFVEHAPFVCRSLRRLGVPEADMDDMLQEAFVVVHQRLPEYREVGRLRSWLYSICRRLAQAQRRKLFRRRESLMPSPPEQHATGGQEERVENRESLALGEELLARLPTEQREVFVLYEVEELGMAEIADALGCPLQTAYSRLYAARARVLNEVERLKQGERP